MKYCESIYKTKRWRTREVLVGKIGVGGENPIRIQSMTTSDTRDVEATIDQIIKLADHGCEIARVTVQGMKEADACEEIKNGLVKRGYEIPLVADIHFYPPAAMRVVDSVDKVRINPGNFVDRRATFRALEYTDESYAAEIAKIEEKFTPLVEKCKRLKRAMRIGTNHGSLSDRIMNRYGDTPQGMVESAIEFAHVCRQNDYHDFIFSMKASNPQVMIQAYRLLVARMIELGWDYPLHLGVTEAGEGEDGRIKSAMGIGSLLLDGLGDTIRVSLTEDPWYEIDPCKRLITFAEHYLEKGVAPFEETGRSIDDITKRAVTLPKAPTLHRDGSVIVRVSQEELENPNLFENLGYEVVAGRPKVTSKSVDALVLDGTNKGPLEGFGFSFINPLSLQEAASKKGSVSSPLKILGSSNSQEVVYIDEESEKNWDLIREINPAAIFLRPKDNRLHFARYFFEWLKINEPSIPVILNFSYTCSREDLVIKAAAECGSLLADGLGEGLFIEAPCGIDFLRNLSLNILQSARLRTTKTEFISCPGCGRTLFNLQEVSKRIRERTSHLPGVKIAIMGCIVNGPGEMADADFGYVGSRPGKIDLYVGKECVERNIDFADADERLIDLIKAHGRWVDNLVEAGYSP